MSGSSSPPLFARVARGKKEKKEAAETRLTRRIAEIDGERIDDEIPMFDDDATTGTTKRGVQKRSKSKAADSFVLFCVEGIQGAGPQIFLWGAGSPKPRPCYLFFGGTNTRYGENS